MPLVVYTLLRAAILLVAAAGLYLLGMRGLLLVAVAILLAALLSYLVLPRQRQAAAVYLAERAQRRGRPRFAAAMEDDARAEDEAAEGLAQPVADEPSASADGPSRPAVGPVQPAAGDPARSGAGHEARPAPTSGRSGGSEDEGDAEK
ncbi:DUF4229 domain-containing protein [Georgenia wangjunii]|uniref:DUF4229 domain-containing protein n=1 Tax=Georgenia wangjunii TaxID=3117730 RepID=UPI002F26A49B